MSITDVPFEPGELLVGTRPVSAFTGLTREQVLYAARAGHLPHAKIGKRIYCRRSELVAWLAEATARTAAEVAAAKAAKAVKQAPEGGE